MIELLGLSIQKPEASFQTSTVVLLKNEKIEHNIYAPIIALDHICSHKFPIIEMYRIKIKKQYFSKSYHNH